LTLHPDKTRLLPFQRPEQEQQDGKGPATFDFLGFTLYWRRTRRGRWRLACKTRRARLGRAIRAVYAWCRSQRHEEVKAQHAGLRSRLQGHYNYFGVNGNLKSLACLLWQVRRAWHKWLSRCSQRTRWTWERFQDLLRISLSRILGSLCKSGDECPRDVTTEEPDGGNLLVRI